MFIVRNLFGLATLWGTLETEGDFRAIVRSLLSSTEAARARATGALDS